jgi:hypothetical protein
MPETGTPSPLPDTTPLYRLIRRTRALLRCSWVATGLGLTCGLLVASLAAVAFVDLIVPLGPAFRLGGLLLITVPAAWAFFAGVVRPLCRRLSSRHVARRIEAHLPGIHNRLVSCIDLDTSQRDRPVSPAFYRRLLAEALERIRSFRARTVIDVLSLRRAGMFTLAGAAVLLLALAVFGERLPTAVARVFRPFEDIPPASGVEYAVVTPDPDARVLRGEDLVFAVEVRRGEPPDLQLELRGEGHGEPLWHGLKKQDATHWQVALSSSDLGPGFEHAVRYRVHGGGTWTRERRVTVVDRPVLTELHTVLHYPPYMGIPAPRVSPPQTPDVTGPEESQVEVLAQVEGDIKEAEVQFVDWRKRRLEGGDRVEQVWFDGRLPAGAAADGTWHWDAQTHGRPTHSEPPFAGTHGHWFHGASAGFPVRPGEYLFGEVYIPADDPPDTVMLQWHDGTSWEHRAYWGLDNINLGKPDSPAHQRMGLLPPTGRWVRLEIPADVVGLEGKALRGMSFTLCGGKCFWGRAGTLRVEEEALLAVKTFSMGADGDNRWSGTFPLRGGGLYRVVLRNELGHANKAMKEAKYVAVPDNPPQIVLERPGADLVLSTPGKVPLVLAAYDDFGLAELCLVLQRGDRAPWERQAVRRYDKPQRSDNLVTGLDLAGMGLKVGEFVRYRAEARDRKGQVAKTPDFVVRVTDDANAADRQLAAFEKAQDPFQQNLVNLIARQAKVREAVERLAVKYAAVNEKVQAAQTEAQLKAAEAGANPEPQPQLDPELEKQLEALRKRLGELANQENQNTELAKQIANDLARSAEQARGLQMLPPQVADELQAMQQMFQRLAVHPLQNLAGQMAQGADPKQAAPDLRGMRRTSDRLQQELEAMRSRADALREAERRLRENAVDALAQMRRDVLRQKGALTERELEDLRRFIAALKQELKDQEGRQGALQKATEAAPDSRLDQLAQNQSRMDKQSEKMLEDARALQASDKIKRMRKRRDPSFPEAPFDPEADEKMARPTEEDPDEPEPGKQDAKSGSQVHKDQKDREEDDEDLYMPALGGPKKVDPRFKDKMRHVERTPREKGQRSPRDRRGNLEQHQAQQLRELNQARSSLESDEKSLGGMLRQLRQAMKSSSSRSAQRPGGQAGSSQQSQDLARMLQSQALQQALSMAARVRGIQQATASRSGQLDSAQAAVGNLQGTPPVGAPLEAQLGKLDLRTRAALLRMQPRMREELLQSMREEGPEAYRRFIEEYYKRLTEVKPSK